MNEKGKPKKKKPWFRLLVGALYFNAGYPLSYCFRQWLFDMARPENLSIITYEGMERQGYCSLADPDMNLRCWGKVDVIKSCYQFGFLEVETPVTPPKTCSDTLHQNT